MKRAVDERSLDTRDALGPLAPIRAVASTGTLAPVRQDALRKRAVALGVDGDDTRCGDGRGRVDP